MAENAPSGNSGANQGEALLAILDDITRQVQHARAVPMSASAMVNRAELLDLVAAAREAVPDQVAAADRIVAEAEGVRSHAVHEGEEIVAQAHAKAADLVAEHAIVGEAKGRAAEIVAAAEEEAKGLRADSDRYADQRLAEMESDLDAALNQVRAGRARLAGRLGTK